MAAKQAYSYLRVSGRGQLEGDGFPRQRLAIDRYARAQGIDIIAEFREEGVCGENELQDRPGLVSLMAAVETSNVRLVLVERSDRFARDLIVGEIILADMRKAGVAVWSAEGGVDLTVGDDDPTKRLIRQILGAVAEYDKAITVLKLRAARERIRKRLGRCEGRKPYGARPGERETLERMMQLRRKPRGDERMSYGRIAKQLAAEGHATRTGKPWTAASVQTILCRAAQK